MISRIFPALALVLWLGSNPRLAAVTLEQMSMDQLAQASTGIVRGTVTGVSTAQNGGTIFTHYAIKIDEQWKGAWGASVDVALPGGVYNWRRQTFPGVPALVPGQEYVLYLWSAPGAAAQPTGPAQPTGMVQGIFNVATDAGGTVVAWRPASGELMVNSLGKAVTDRAMSMQLVAMRSQVQAALRKGKSK